jgi:hypothetical protein
LHNRVKIGKSSKFIKNPVIFVKKLIIMLIQLKLGRSWHAAHFCNLNLPSVSYWLLILELLPFFHQICKILILFVLYFKNYKR